MSDHDAIQTPRRAAYLRSVTFLDADPRSGESRYPVHVTGRVLFDGEPVSFVRDAHVELPRKDATVLVMTVDAGAVHSAPAAEDEHGMYQLGGFPVLLPTDDVASREPRFWDDNGDGTWTVAIFVDHLHVQPHTFGDRVTDGGVLGTLVRCPECGGAGQLHKPDQTPATAQPQDA